MNILLIHGLIGSLSNPNLLQGFDAQTSVITPDLLGYGANQHVDTAQLSLSDHVSYLAAFLGDSANAPVHVVGHSVGGAVGLMLASDFPHLVSSYTSVEGNMTLKDAFWSSEIAKTPIADVETIVQAYKNDVAGWLQGAVDTPTSEQLLIAKEWLDNQPATTIKAQANAVVKETCMPDYLQRFNTLKSQGIAIHLLAGEKSLSGWDLPDNVLEMSQSMLTLKNCGHLMMLENPALFADSVCQPLR